jgi:3-hydroxyisobutyrate dehydrogenase-like beta-hydroxyacid dehydrogenase
MMKIAFVGLGNMGMPMARLLIDAGYSLAVYNRNAAKAKALLDLGARLSPTPGAAAAQADVMITMLADEAALQDVLGGPDGAFLHLPRGALHIGMSTVSVAFSRQISARHAENGQTYLAAPVFGRPDAAAAKKLWVVAAGRAADMERARPLLESMGQGVLEVGDDPAQASTVKLAGNYMIAGMIQSLSEAFALVRKAGLPPERFLDVINKVFKSPVYENYGKQIAAERFTPPGFKLRLGMKDLRLVLAAADAVETPMPLASLLHDRLLSAMARGMGELDWSALGRLAAEDAGLPRSEH